MISKIFTPKKDKINKITKQNMTKFCVDKLGIENENKAGFVGVVGGVSTEGVVIGEFSFDTEDATDGKEYDVSSLGDSSKSFVYPPFIFFTIL